MITKKCLNCNCSFQTYNYLKKNERKFCSRQCSSEHQKISFSGKNNPFYGRNHTPEAIKKISQSRMGKTSWNKGLKGYGAGKNHPMKRPEIALKSKLNRKGMSVIELKKASERMKKNNPVKRKEVREKISKTLTGRPQPWSSGANCNFWKGGLSDKHKKLKNSLEYKTFIRTVYYRDNYKCRKCGEGGGKLNVHHIKNFAKHKKLRTIPSNGITLCLKCHRQFHRKYGVKNNTIKQIKEFLIH